jgi:D-glycero-D-manno-heptose 1,7-bisphosphate phosphatase
MAGKPAVFVDRDGTICFDKHYLADPAGLEFIPTVVDGLRKLTKAGVPIIIVTNQSGVARGYFTEGTLVKIHKELVKILEKQGVSILDIFYCPHMPDAGCDCRKPAPGLLIRASKKHGIELSKSYVIGDRMMDVELAHKVNAKGVLVPEPGDQYGTDKEITASKEKPDFMAGNFSEAADWALSRLKQKV